MFRKQEWDSEDSQVQIIPPRKPQPAQIPLKRPMVIEAKAVPSSDPSPAAPSPAQADAAEARQDNAKQDNTQRGAKSAQRFSRRTLALGSVGMIALAAAGWFGVEWLTVGRFTVSTDDAYVQAYNTTLAAKVPGYVANVAVTDNTRVRAGDVIATIDDGDYRLAAESARNKVATQQATIARIGHQIEAQNAAVEQAKAQVTSAQAMATRTQLELDRQNKLAAQDYASHQTLEQAQANRDQAVAGVQAARAALDSAAANVDVLSGQQQEAAGTLDELKTALAKAERDLSFTVIRAPIDGVIGNRAVQTGDYLQPGQRLASLVPLDDVYVDANFKETQLARLRPGQPVRISVDALPEDDINGSIESLAPASGAVFSLLPPDNATGNFTKIVQRLPVRISVPSNVASQGRLRPGMSVVVRVNTKAAVLADADTQNQATR
jgi:membrane fusion protein (multidrug efflux system)